MDLIFGTYHHPKEEPAAFGLDTPIPRSFLGQLAFPLRKMREERVGER
jgi:sterol desaturase/sphingolipid hydroxylase (fatty acid hydroxylase superfamily)